MKLLALALVFLIWFVPPLITRLGSSHPWRVRGSLGSLVLGFMALLIIMFYRYGWSDQFWAGAAAAALYSGLVLLFTILFLRLPAGRRARKRSG